MGFLHAECSHDYAAVVALRFKSQREHRSLDIAEISTSAVLLPLNNDKLLVGQMLNNCLNLSAELSKHTDATMAVGNLVSVCFSRVGPNKDRALLSSIANSLIKPLVVFAVVRETIRDERTFDFRWIKFNDCRTCGDYCAGLIC